MQGSQHELWGVQFSQHHLSWGVSCSLVCPWSLCPKLTDPVRVGWILVSLSCSSGPCACFEPVPHCFGDCRFSAECDVREGDASSPFSCFRVSLAIWGPLWFPTDIRRICSILGENTTEFWEGLHSLCPLLWVEWIF